MRNKCLVSYAFCTISLALSNFFSWSSAKASSQFGVATWEEGEEISPHGRANPYGFAPAEWQQRVESGRRMALNYPVAATGQLLPLRPLLNFLEGFPESQPLRRLLSGAFKFLSRIKTLEDLEKTLNLPPFPKENEAGVYAVPYPNGERPTFRMGTSFLETPQGTGLTFSCATCHSGVLFGKSVLGLTNRFPRASEFFVKGKLAVGFVDSHVFQAATSATSAEREMFETLKANTRFIEGKKPSVLGLDTSLAHVALSLSHREPDAFASKTNRYRERPRSTFLRQTVADSKPAVWWNLKYKNRWLLDGSVISGNPIYTNIIWNEIGRGADLEDVSQWLQNNNDVVTNLTAAAFASEAPKYTDFFPASSLNLASAKRGEALFAERCARCHGSYAKAWHNEKEMAIPTASTFLTTQVTYHANTPVVDVGTSSLRASGMQALAEPLNRLELSKSNGVVVEVQRGYVPPPLEGVWARWPYFHNNSAPSLCAVLTASAKRPTRWFAGEANSKETDFDKACVGYPLGAATPKSWMTNKEAAFDARRPGLSNSGHDEGIFLKNGEELLSDKQKLDLIEFLKTL